MTSCEEALVFQGRWHELLLDGEGRLQVDAQRCCFHVAGDFKPSHMESATDAGVRQIRQHLLAHDKAVSSLLRRVQTFQDRLRKHRQMPLLGNSLQCTTDDLPPDFASRTQAFQSVAARVTPGQLIQQLCAGSTDFEQRLPAIDATDLLLRPGSAALPAPGAGDGWCVLQLDTRRSRVHMAPVQRTEDCARHVHAVCFQIIYNDLQWKRLDDAHGHVITMFPRFGWRHDFSLPLERVRWRRADFLGATQDWWANKRVKSSQQPSVSQPESRLLSRCNAALESCQTAFRLTPQDCTQLRELFPVVLVWFSNSRGQVQALSACSCASCGSPLRSLGVRAPSRLGLGRDYLFHTLAPVARCTASGCAVRRKVSLAQEGTVTPPVGALSRVAFDVFGGRVVDQKLTDWLRRTFRKHFNQAALRASYADLLGTALTCQHTSCSPQLHNLVYMYMNHRVPGASRLADICTHVTSSVIQQRTRLNICQPTMWQSIRPGCPSVWNPGLRRKASKEGREPLARLTSWRQPASCLSGAQLRHTCSTSISRSRKICKRRSPCTLGRILRFVVKWAISRRWRSWPGSTTRLPIVRMSGVSPSCDDAGGPRITQDFHSRMSVAVRS